MNWSTVTGRTLGGVEQLDGDDPGTVHAAIPLPLKGSISLHGAVRA